MRDSINTSILVYTLGLGLTLDRFQLYLSISYLSSMAIQVNLFKLSYIFLQLTLELGLFDSLLLCTLVSKLQYSSKTGDDRNQIYYILKISNSVI